MHHLRSVNYRVLYDIHGVKFETTVEVDEERGQDKGE